MQLRSLVTLLISGKNVPRFIFSLYHRGIRFYHLEYHEKSAEVTVSSSDYLKIMEIPTIYEIHVLKYQGFQYFQKLFQRYRLFLGCICLGIFFLFFLSHIIFDVTVVHDKKEVVTFLKEELQKKGISKFSFVKGFDEGKRIGNEILNEHREKFEWLSIERVGCKYIVRVETRKMLSQEKEDTPRDLIAKKKGVIVSIQAKNGEVLKKIGDYVEAGDVIVTGVIKNKDVVKDHIRATGEVFAETWYRIQVEVPYFYKESRETGRKKRTFGIRFLDFEKRFFDSFKEKEDTVLFSMGNPLFPISFSLLEEKEIFLEDSLYSYDMALLKARSIARERLEEALSENSSIIYEKNLKNYEEDSKIVVEMFFKVREDITSYVEINPFATLETPSDAR